MENIYPIFQDLIVKEGAISFMIDDGKFIIVPGLFNDEGEVSFYLSDFNPDKSQEITESTKRIVRSSPIIANLGEGYEIFNDNITENSILESLEKDEYRKYNGIPLTVLNEEMQNFMKQLYDYYLDETEKIEKEKQRLKEEQEETERRRVEAEKEEQEKQWLAEEAARKAAEEDARIQKEKEEAARKAEEDKKAAEEAALKKAAEDKRIAEAELERQRIAAEQEKQRLEQEEAIRLQAEEQERLRKAKEEADRLQREKEAEEAARIQREKEAEEERKRLAEDEERQNELKRLEAEKAERNQKIDIMLGGLREFLEKKDEEFKRDINTEVQSMTGTENKKKRIGITISPKTIIDKLDSISDFKNTDINSYFKTSLITQFFNTVKDFYKKINEEVNSKINDTLLSLNIVGQLKEELKLKLEEIKKKLHYYKLREELDVQYGSIYKGETSARELPKKASESFKDDIIRNSFYKYLCNFLPEEMYSQLSKKSKCTLSKVSLESDFNTLKEWLKSSI